MMGISCFLYLEIKKSPVGRPVVGKSLRKLIVYFNIACLVP